MKKKKGFTLVELLAVIVILAVVLVIAVPRITDVIKNAKKSSMEDSAHLIATQAEKQWLINQTLSPSDPGYVDLNSSDACSKVSKYNSSDYQSCSLRVNDNGEITSFNMTGKGKFAGLKCTGTNSSNITCSESDTSLLGYSDAAELLVEKYNNGTNSDGLIKVTHDKTQNAKFTAVEYRYQGSNPNNYVYFNCSDYNSPTSSTCELWRIIGLFDGRLKLVRNDSLGHYSWDAADASYGINQWGESGTYEGSDLMMELNGDYLNYSLTANTNWYANDSMSDSDPNRQTNPFNYTKVLNQTTQELIYNATWYLGGSSTTEVSVEAQYALERGNVTCVTASTTICNYDEVERTTSWTGKVGLIYPSDFGYASGGTCTTLNTDCGTNWLSVFGFTISPASQNGYGVLSAYSNKVSIDIGGLLSPVHPSVYLIPEIQMRVFDDNSTYVAGSENNPYVIAG